MPDHRTPPSHIKGISRIDSPRAHGWLVRSYWQGQTHSKFFSDSRYEGTQQALKRAIEYRDEYEREQARLHPLVTMGRLPFRTKPQRNNKTGVNGISETVHITRTGERARCFSVYYSPEPGVACNKRFYIDEYDDREAAFQAAVEFRRAMEAQMLRDHKRRYYEAQRPTAGGNGRRSHKSVDPDSQS